MNQINNQTRIIKDDELTLGQVFLLAFKKWITFKGRASRYQYWPVMTIYYILEGLAGTFFHIESFIKIQTLLVSWESYALFLLVCLPLFIVNVSLKVRRLQDAYWEGWIAWIYGIMCIMAVLFQSEGFLIIASILYCIIFVVSFFKGTKGPNKYGPDPKDDVEWEARGLFEKGAFQNAKKWIIRLVVVSTLVAISVMGIVGGMAYFEKQKSDAFIATMVEGSFFTLKVDDSSKNPYTFGKIEHIDEENISVQLSKYNYAHLSSAEKDMNKTKTTGDTLSSPITFSRKEFQDLNIKSVG